MRTWRCLARMGSANPAWKVRSSPSSIPREHFKHLIFSLHSALKTWISMISQYFKTQTDSNRLKPTERSERNQGNEGSEAKARPFRAGCQWFVGERRIPLRNLDQRAAFPKGKTFFWSSVLRMLLTLSCHAYSRAVKRAKAWISRAGSPG